MRRALVGLLALSLAACATAGTPAPGTPAQGGEALEGLASGISPVLLDQAGVGDVAGSALALDGMKEIHRAAGIVAAEADCDVRAALALLRARAFVCGEPAAAIARRSAVTRVGSRRCVPDGVSSPSKCGEVISWSPVSDNFAVVRGLSSNARCSASRNCRALRKRSSGRFASALSSTRSISFGSRGSSVEGSGGGISRIWRSKSARSVEGGGQSGETVVDVAGDATLN